MDDLNPAPDAAATLPTSECKYVPELSEPPDNEDNKQNGPKTAAPLEFEHDSAETVSSHLAHNRHIRPLG